MPASTHAEAGRPRWAALAAAAAIVVAVPTALILSLWDNLTAPFWYNEQWHAFYISNPGNWWQALRSDGAPFSAGWYFLERVSGQLFGSTELALRVPSACFLPLACLLLMLLARRWMPLPAAVVVALVGCLTGGLLPYSVQLSECAIDAAAVVAVILLHETADDCAALDHRRVHVYLAYGGMALACVFSTPAVFVAGPILLLDIARGLRQRGRYPMTV